jgi:hypothetical protein
MPQPTNARRAQRLAAALLALMAAAPLVGCTAASRVTLGLGNDIYYAADDDLAFHDGTGAGDAFGSAMFRDHVRLAAAQARRERATSTDYATVNVPVD